MLMAVIYTNIMVHITGADPEGVVWGGTHIGMGGKVMLGLSLVFVKPIF